MKMSEEDIRIFRSVLGDYLQHPAVLRMRGYTAHGSISVYRHCVQVALKAYELNRDLHLNADLHTLLVGALLHDFYLYDWHDRSYSWKIFTMHGYTHPEAARKNAEEIFHVNEKVQKVIKCHMWPLTLRSFPSSKEAAIVCIADKICATKETVNR